VSIFRIIGIILGGERFAIPENRQGRQDFEMGGARMV
jgi:hypothetical protein